jgi:hypothetical protein
MNVLIVVDLSSGYVERSAAPRTRRIPLCGACSQERVNPSITHAEVLPEPTGPIRPRTNAWLRWNAATVSPAGEYVRTSWDFFVSAESNYAPFRGLRRFLQQPCIERYSRATTTVLQSFDIQAYPLQPRHLRTADDLDTVVDPRLVAPAAIAFRAVPAGAVGFRAYSDVQFILVARR